MMNIKQVSVCFVSEQDRILIRISSTQEEELRIWFSRRLTLGLMPVLIEKATTQLKQATAQANVAAPPEQQRERLLESFKNEAMAYSADYSKPYKEDATVLPLGPEPLLVTEMQLTLLASGQLQFQMFEKLADQSRDLQLDMDPQLTQGLVQLLGQSIKQSQWLELPAQTVIAQSNPSADPSDLPNLADKPKYLN